MSNAKDGPAHRVEVEDSANAFQRAQSLARRTLAIPKSAASHKKKTTKKRR